LAAISLAVLQLGAAAQTTGQLQTITVTAERRVENIREVPSAVSALQGEVLDVLNTSGQDVRLLSARVPSLNIESSFGRAFPRFYIRGYGNTDFRLNASQPVSLVYDDVVQENPILKGFPIFDVDRVEVLRGPQGTLFGRNTPAGVVKFDSVKPTNKLEGYGSIGLGTYQTINAEGAVNVPLGQGLSGRVSLLNQTRDDWVKNTYAAGPTQKLEGYRDSALRAQLLYDGGNALSVLANVHARDYKGSARLFRANIIQPGTNNLVAGFDPAQISIDGKNTSELQNYGGNLRVKLDLGGMALYSITGLESVHTYSRGDIDGGYGTVFAPKSGPGIIPFLVESADGMPEHSQFTQEVRLESNVSGPLSWQAGAFLFRESYKVESFTYDSAAANVQNGYERVKQTNDAYALFGAVNYAVSSDLKLRGGLRYTKEKKTFNIEDYNSGDFVPCVRPTLGIPIGPLSTVKEKPRCTFDQLKSFGPTSASPSDNKVTWDASASYALDKNVNLYARAATGYRGSSVQGAGPFNDQSVAKPETNTSLEAGVKADLLNRRARIAFNVFSYDVKDLQLTAVGGSGNANVLLNAKKVSGTGFELDVQALLSENIITTLAVGYNDTKIKDPNLVVSACGNAQSSAVPPVPNCTINNPNFYDAQANAQKANINGNPLPQAPKVTGSFTLKYSQPVANGEVYAFTDWVYRDKVNFFLYQSTEFTGKALMEGGLRVGYAWGSGKYDLAAYGRNITNQIRIVGGIDFNNLTGFINDPRTFGVQFKAQF
jgi:iron complex outermembrane receptor protein